MSPETLRTTKLEDEIEKTNNILQEVLAMVREHDVYISDSKAWRVTIVGVVITMVIQVIGGVYLAGQITEKVNSVSKQADRNETRIDKHDEALQGIYREGRNNFRNNAP